MGDGEWLALTCDPLPLAEAISWVGGSAFGGVGCFFGVVRDHAEGRSGVTAIEYEAYEEQVVPRFSDLVASARERWPEVGRVVLWHRVGEVRLGGPSVAVVVSAPHRAEALEACRYLIDALKATVPIWKREHWPGGAEWSPAAHPLRPVHQSALK